MLFFAALLAFCSLYSFLGFGLTAKQNSLTYAYVWLIMTTLSLIASKSGAARNFLFSCAFWVTVTFLFYIVLKALYTIDEIDPGLLQKALALSWLFLGGYFIGQFIWPSIPIMRPLSQPYTSLPRPSSYLYRWLILSFYGFKLLNWALMFLVGGGSTALEVSAATQNQGASYLFKIPTLANASYFIILLFSYKYGKFKRSALLMTLWIIAEAVLGAGRYTLVTTILINLLLYHMYVRPLRLLYLSLLVPPLVFVISLLGYVRNIEIGSAAVYYDALNVFFDEGNLILYLFMSRLDMLPQMTQALSLAELNQIKFEGGMSYIYSLLHAIPRNLWVDKPPLTAAYVTGLVNPGAYSDGVNIFPSIMLEAYINFLWVGAMIIGIVIAGMSALYDKVLRQGCLRNQAFALMAFTFPMSLINEGLHSNIVASLIYLFVLYIIWLAAIKGFIGRKKFSLLIKY